MSRRKLSDEDVATIKTLYEHGRSSYRLAADYHVSRPVVLRVLHGKSYRVPNAQSKHRHENPIPAASRGLSRESLSIEFAAPLPRAGEHAGRSYSLAPIREPLRKQG